MRHVLEMDNVVKQYSGKTALDEVSISVQEGCCFGLLGPNGAGKSTMMKIITGIVSADRGNIRVLNLNLQEQISSIRRQIGYVPQEITLYDKLSAVQNLKFFGEMYGLRGTDLKKRIAHVLEQVGLTDRASEAIRTYSGGMKRRINIAAALMHNPKLVILDEPTVGIDPQSRNHIFEMIRELRKSGVTIIYSTHYMEEVEALCDEIAIIDHGKVVTQGSLHNLLEQYAVKAVYVEADSLIQPPEIVGVNQVSREGQGWLLESEDALSTLQVISKTLSDSGAQVRALELMKPSLDSVFLKLTGTKLRD